MKYLNFDQSKFEAMLAKSLADRRQAILETLGTGGGIKDFPTYAKWTGYIACLTEVFQMMESVREKLNKEK
jgi:hypothetical protein